MFLDAKLSTRGRFLRDFMIVGDDRLVMGIVPATRGRLPRGVALVESGGAGSGRRTSHAWSAASRRRAC